MSVSQLPEQAASFAEHLRRMVGLLDRRSGWYAAFERREPQALRACLDGVVVAPWDLVESLLQDLASARGSDFAAPVAERTAHMWSAAVCAVDHAPAGAQRLGTELAAARRALGAAEEHHRAVCADLEAEPAAVQRQTMEGELAWARADLLRAQARCRELDNRLAALRGAASPSDSAPSAVTGPVEERSAKRSSPRAARLRRTGTRGARFAGVEGEAQAPVLPALSGPDEPLGVSGPTGARFGARPAEQVLARATPAGAGRAEEEAQSFVAEVVGELLVLRARGMTGEAYAVLCRAAAGPPAALPLFAVQLRRSGLSADWATLLWEAASLPPERLAAAAGALAASGRPQDCGQLLRQGVARPPAEIADAVLALTDAGRQAEAAALLDAFVRVRSAQDSALLTERDPRRLAPRLLETAGAVSEARGRELAHALRVAGVPLG
ncbi:hypothetical protein [Streptomyces sp. NPDC006879]|uniref:hypothetical protein n=1 Tax=Streptomyces sp. NPDC006879 TaxID=3364767 RepID=UPI0036CFF6B1